MPELTRAQHRHLVRIAAAAQRIAERPTLTAADERGLSQLLAEADAVAPDRTEGATVMPLAEEIDRLSSTEREQRAVEVDGAIDRLESFPRLTVGQRDHLSELREEQRALADADRAHAAGQSRLRSAYLGGHSEAGSPPDRDAPRHRAGTSEARGRALDLVADLERRDSPLSRDALEHVVRLVERDPDRDDAISRWVSVSADPAYRSAFHALMRDPQNGHRRWSENERSAYAAAQEWQSRALALSPDSAGGYLVPFELDPNVILTGGTSNVDLRRAFTTRVIASDVWHGVSSAGISAEWVAEAAESADAAPTFAQPSIPVHRLSAWVPFSYEVEQDGIRFAEEIGRLLTDAKLRKETAAFITGTGTGQPAGLVTAALAATPASTVASATADTFALADVYAMKRALPGMHRANAAWLANDNVFDLARQFATGTGPSSAFWTDLGAGTPPQLLGRPVFETSEMDGGIDANQANSVLVYGDLSRYVVVDRIGTLVELVPHVMGPNGRPTGQRGMFMFARVGGGLVDANAVRVLVA